MNDKGKDSADHFQYEANCWLKACAALREIECPAEHIPVVAALLLIGYRVEMALAEIYEEMPDR